MKPDDIEEAKAALRLSRSPGVGAAGFKKLVLAHGSARQAEEATGGQLSSRRKQAKSGTEAGLENANAFLERGGTVLVLGSPTYPSLLLEMSEPPPVLFVRGSIEALARPLVAVVGARDCSERGLEKASEATSLLVSRGFGVASGGARGIDGKSHEIALSLGGCTVAVLGTGVDIVYPAAHKQLFRQIEEAGALVSELLPGTPPAPKFFPTRNRIIAGLSLAVILIEGRRISGSLSTARWAIKLGRPVASPVQESNEGLGEATAILRELGGCVYADGNELQEFLRPIRDGVFAGPAQPDGESPQS